MLQFAETITAVGGTDQFAHSRDLVVLLSQKQLNCVKKQEEHLNTMIKSFVEVRISTALVRDPNNGVSARSNLARFVLPFVDTILSFLPDLYGCSGSSLTYASINAVLFTGHASKGTRSDHRT